jgi:hypothetical protein
MKRRELVVAAGLSDGLVLALLAGLLAVAFSCTRPSSPEGRGDTESFSKDPDRDNIFRNDGGTGLVLNQALVLFKVPPAPRQVEKLARSVGGKVVGQHPPSSFQLEVPAKTPEELHAILRKLNADPRVASAGPNIIGAEAPHHH